MSCGSKIPQEKPPRILKYITAKEEFGDFGFISEIRGSQFFESKCYISDSQNGRVLRLSENLDEEMQFGTLGPGPGEFNGSSQLFVNQDNLFVGNGRQEIARFNKAGNYEGIIQIPGGQTLTRFVVWRQNLFLSSPRQKKMIRVFDEKGSVVNQFGEPHTVGEDEPIFTRNFNHLGLAQIEGEPYLVAVNMTEPIINLFTMEGKLVFKKVLRHGIGLQKQLNRHKAFNSQIENQKIASTFFPDIQIVGDRLYALVYAVEPPTFILKFRLNKSGLVKEETFQIEGRGISKFTPAPDQYFLTYHSQMLHVFLDETKEQP